MNDIDPGVSPVPALTLPGGSEVKIPQIGLGTWPHVGDECREMVETALGNGYRHIDTAEKYGNEDAVGQAVRESGLTRAEVFVTSKLTNATFGDTMTVKAGLESTLERMGLDHLDLYLIHWPNPWRAADNGTFLQTAQSLAELVARGDGPLRAWGVSNFAPEHLQVLLSHGLVPGVNQVQVDPFVGQPEVLAANRDASVLTAAYSPLGRAGNILGHSAIIEAAKRLDVTPGQIVLRWHVQHGRAAIPRSANLARQRMNLNVFNFRLTPEEMSSIDTLGTGKGPRLDPDSYGH